jgi:hypothetical protein
MAEVERIFGGDGTAAPSLTAAPPEAERGAANLAARRIRPAPRSA